MLHQSIVYKKYRRHPCLQTKKNNYKVYLITITAIVVLTILSLSLKHLSKAVNGKHNNNTQTASLQPIKITTSDIKNNKLILPPTKKGDAASIKIPARSAILMDAQSSFPLYMKNEREQVPIASITKIMTATIALENYELTKVVIVPRSAATISGSQMDLITNENITVENLLWGLMLVSGNDAAYTLAGLSNSKDPSNYKPFVDKMNQKAKLLGLKDTKYFDPAGLDDRGHSSAYDLAVLTSYAMKNPTFAQIVSTVDKTVEASDKKYIHQLKNSNRLIVPTESLYLSTAIGVKTGYTEEAGHSLVAAARQDGHTLVSVVLNTNLPTKPESARLNRLLLTWGFSSFVWQNNF